MASTTQEQPQSVRFSDVNEEIEPEKAVEPLCDVTGVGKHAGPMSPQAEEELRNLSSTLQKSRCQAKRMENFSFEPVSLPASRVSIQTNHQWHILLLGAYERKSQGLLCNDKSICC
jgi:hypothetical protein